MFICWQELLTHSFPLIYSLVTTSSHLSCHIHWRIECGVIFKCCSVHLRAGVWHIAVVPTPWAHGNSQEARKGGQPALFGILVQPQLRLASSGHNDHLLPSPQAGDSIGQKLGQKPWMSIPPLEPLERQEHNGLQLLIAREHHSEARVKVSSHEDLIHGVPGWPFLLGFKLAKNKNISTMIYPFKLSLSIYL